MQRRALLKSLGAAGAVTAAGATGVAGATDASGNEVVFESSHDGRGDVPLAQVSVAHLSPDAPAVDIYVNNFRAVSDVAFGDISDYFALPAGTYTAKITPAGDPDTVVFEGDVELDAQFYTLAAVGEVGNATLQPLLLVDGDVALVRLVHTVPDAPAVDVTVGDGEAVIFDGVGFAESSGYVQVPAGDYTLEVRPDTEDNTGDVVTTFDVSLEGTVSYSAYATGYLDPESAGADADRAFDLRVIMDGSDGLDV